MKAILLLLLMGLLVVPSSASACTQINAYSQGECLSFAAGNYIEFLSSQTATTQNCLGEDMSTKWLVNVGTTCGGSDICAGAITIWANGITAGDTYHVDSIGGGGCIKICDCTP